MTLKNKNREFEFLLKFIPGFVLVGLTLFTLFILTGSAMILPLSSTVSSFAPGESTWQVIKSSSYCPGSIFKSQQPIHHTVYLMSPGNDTWTNKNKGTLTFIYNHTGFLTGVVNCTLYIDNIAVNFSSDVPANQPISVYSNQSFGGGVRHWNVTCINGTASDPSKTYLLNVDRTVPSVNFTDPTPTGELYRNLNWVYVNVSVNDSDAPQISSFIDWNRTLSGYWSFEHVLLNGTVYDNSTYGNDGVMRGFDTNTAIMGKYGDAIKFDGDNDYIDCGADAHLNFGLNDTFTIGAWIKKDFKNTKQIIADTIQGIPCIDCSGYMLRVEPTGMVMFKITNGTGNTTAISSTNVSDNQWYFIVAVKNPGNLSIYINGVLENSSIIGISGDISGDDLWIGAGPIFNGANAVENFNGTIDEVRVWKRALSQEEINASYNSKADNLHGLHGNFTDLTDGYYEYYAYSIDLAGNSNKTETMNITIDTVAPTIYLQSPDNDTENRTDRTPDFVFNVSDNLAPTLSCELIISGTGYGINASVQNGTSTQITANDSLPNSNYLWWINCSDGINTNISENRDLTINVIVTIQAVLYKTGDIMLRYGTVTAFMDPNNLAGISIGNSINYFNNVHGNESSTAFYQYSGGGNVSVGVEESYEDIVNGIG